MQKNIVLCGFMGSGKSSVGKMLSKLLNRDFIDTDSYIEQLANQSISDIFAEHGEQEFRKMENRCAEKLEKKENLIIATGGGMLTFSENSDKLRKNSIIFFLDIPISVIKERLKNDTSRPLFNRDDKNDEMIRLYNQRLPLYQKASHFIIDADRSLRRICSDICLYAGINIDLKKKL